MEPDGSIDGTAEGNSVLIVVGADDGIADRAVGEFEANALGDGDLRSIDIAIGDDVVGAGVGAGDGTRYGDDKLAPQDDCCVPY